MRPQRQAWPTLFSVLLLFRASSATLYVSLNSPNPVPPYADWSTAATNIQDAVDASSNGDLVLVTNGVYRSGGRMSGDGATNGVIVTNTITLESVNGPAVTLIDGNQSMRCVYLTDGATLAGLTATNGNAGTNFGGGVFCTSTNALISNCILVKNSAKYGGGAYSGALTNCLLMDNTSSRLTFAGAGASHSYLIQCTLASNTFDGAAFSTLYNCVVTNNNGIGLESCTAFNCLIAGNEASGLDIGSLYNCTVVGNGQFGVAVSSSLDNCIIYYNTVSDPNRPPPRDVYQSGPVANCCCSQEGGLNCFTNPPSFVDMVHGNYRLQMFSPCINSGNNGYVTSATDLDGNPRIVGGTVDIGAYECQTPVSQISYAWLQQYGLSIDTNTDTTDSDGDGLNNYQEWIAGTNPTNALSLLVMLSPVPTNNPSGLVLGWQSVNNRTYFLQSRLNLGGQPAFTTIQSNIAGQSGITTYTDTNAVGSGPFFYRVGVQ